MNPIAIQQAALDNALVPPEKRLKIERCNARIAFSKPQREETYQVTLEALNLSPCYPAFQITVEVPKIYMHQFWTTIKKIKNSDAYNFKLENKKFRVDMEVFHEILQICPKILNQDFIAPPSEEELPWRTFAAIMNRCISGKTTGLDRLRESRAQILWVMYNKKNVDYVALLWEDFMYQANNREISSARKEHMPYPRFTKVIINHFISKNITIYMRNKINLHTIRDDSLLGTLKFVSKTQDYQQYGALIPDDMINQDIKVSIAYKTYYDFATGKVPPRKARKYKKFAAPSRKLSLINEAEPVKKTKRVNRSAKKSTTAPTAGVAIRDTPGVSVLKKKAPAKADRSKGIEILSGVALSEAAQLKEAIKRSKKDLHISQASGSNDNDDDSKDDNDDDVSKGDDDKADSDDDDGNEVHDNKRTNLDDDDDENPSFTLKDYNEKEHNEDYESDDDNENVFEEDDDNDLYKDVDMRSLGTKHDESRSTKHSDTLSSHSTCNDHSFFFYYCFNNRSSNNINDQQPLQLQPLPQLTTPTPAPTTASTTTLIPALLDFSSLFGFDQRVSTLETELSRLKQADLSAQVLEFVKSQLPTMVDDLLTASLREFELKKILLDKLEKSKLYRAAEDHRNLYDALIKSYHLGNDLFDSYGKAYSLNRSHDDKDEDEDPPAGSNQGLKTISTKSQPKSSGKSMQAEEPVFETADIEIPQYQGGDVEDQPNVEVTRMDDWFKKPSKPPTPDRPWNDGKYINSRPPHKWIDNIAKATQPPHMFDELMRPAFNLLKGTCKIFVELKYHFEECYKFVTDQLDWNNLKGHEYPFDLSKPLPLIEAQGRQVVPADYFFNNDLEYLKGESSSRKYTTSTTKTKADKYDNIEGIEDMVLKLWSLVKVAYDKFATWGISHWGPKRQKFYGYASNRSDISKLTSYTAYKNSQGIIYQDKFKRNRLMRSDELYKFCEGTLTSVRRVLHDIANNWRMDYLPKRRWSNLDIKRSCIMIQAIDQQLFERGVMMKLFWRSSLEGEKYGM
ncbi:hypothetical protein Tco_0902163 [Tanacetum coccineum]